MLEMDDDGPVIETKGLRKEFPGLVAVDSLDLRVARGTLYGLIGPNGSGKTTAIKVIVGLMRASAGEARVLGERVPLRTNRHRLGYMPQDIAIYPDLTVRENLEFFAGLYSIPKPRIGSRTEEVLKVVDLLDRKDGLVSHLSGGMRHRVSLACALVHDPEVLFLDEPTVGIDPMLRVQFWEYFRHLNTQGVTIVVSSHAMDEAERCDRLGFMRDGRLLAEGTAGELRARAGAGSLEEAFLLFAGGRDVRH